MSPLGSCPRTFRSVLGKTLFYSFYIISLSQSFQLISEAWGFPDFFPPILDIWSVDIYDFSAYQIAMSVCWHLKNTRVILRERTASIHKDHTCAHASPAMFSTKMECLVTVCWNLIRLWLWRVSSDDKVNKNKESQYLESVTADNKSSHFNLER